MTEDERVLLDTVYSGIFRIDSNGFVWRIQKKHKEYTGYKTCTPRLMGHDNHGYIRICQRDETGVNRKAFAHRLVFLYFYGYIADGLQVNHKDGNGYNNHPDNLELMTASQQMIHAIHVLGRPCGAKIGNEYWKKRKDLKLTEQDYSDIQKSDVPRKELAKRYGVTPERIGQVKLHYHQYKEEL